MPEKKRRPQIKYANEPKSKGPVTFTIQIPWKVAAEVERIARDRREERQVGFGPQGLITEAIYEYIRIHGRAQTVDEPDALE